MNANDWMKQNGHTWKSQASNPSREPLVGEYAKGASGKVIAKRRIKRSAGRGAAKAVTKQTMREYVESMRDLDQHECFFFPGAIKGSPQQVNFCGRKISAARYMCLLTHGAPKHEGAVARHLCGNGHLSCINPKHIAWGDVGDNQSDANHHRTAGDDVQDRINATTR